MGPFGIPIVRNAEARAIRFEEPTFERGGQFPKGWLSEPREPGSIPSGDQAWALDTLGQRPFRTRRRTPRLISRAQTGCPSEPEAGSPDPVEPQVDNDWD